METDIIAYNDKPISVFVEDIDGTICIHDNGLLLGGAYQKDKTFFLDTTLDEIVNDAPAIFEEYLKQFHMTEDRKILMTEICTFVNEVEETARWIKFISEQEIKCI